MDNNARRNSVTEDLIKLPEVLSHYISPLQLQNRDRMGRMMWMWFHSHINDTLLVKDWWIQNAGTMIWSCIVVAVFAIGLEAVRWIRWIAEVRHTKVNTNTNTKWWSHLCDPSHHVNVALYAVQTVMAYLLMLAFMTFSLWLCLSLCLGLAIGHYFFGTKRFKLSS